MSGTPKEAKRVKKSLKFRKDPSFEIVVKVDGQIQSFNEENENTDEPTVDSVPQKIEAEETLSMIKKALKGKKSKSVKKKAKKGESSAVKLDSVSRFFNDYGESPHL